MWVFIWEHAEVVALDSFAVGDRVAFSCRDHHDFELDLPPDVIPSGVLIEDADYAVGTDGGFVEVLGDVRSIRVARDQWRRLSGTRESFAIPGSRNWTYVDGTRDLPRDPESPGPDWSAFLVDLCPKNVKRESES